MQRMGLRRKWNTTVKRVLLLLQLIQTTSFEASTTGYAHEPEYTACELEKLTPYDEISSDNSDDDDLD